MKSKVLPVSFINKDGHKLMGILHKPDTRESKKECIIILSPGIKSRIAPHRLYVKMAQSFAEQGFHVLRFDFYGLGDSEGEIEEEYAADFYGSVQVGRYISDTLFAMDWLEKEYNISKFILAGLCGGAITGLLTAEKDERVKGLLSLAIPVILDSSNIVYDDFLTPTELKRKKVQYVSKLFSVEAWRSWVRFLTFQSDYRLIFRAIYHKKSQQDKDEKSSDENVVRKDNRNPFFPTAFQRVALSKTKMLFIFAESDRLYWQFKENFIEANNIDLEQYENTTLHVIGNANHIFSLLEWQEELIEKSLEWL